MSTRRGRPVIELDGYRYYKNNRSKGRIASWFCAQGRSYLACRASLITRDNVVVTVKNTAAQHMFTTSRFGKPAIQVGKYRFNKNNRSYGPRVLWVCCRVSSGCRASITTIDDVIIKEKSTHNH
ncbi:unnamed protein product [Parnassius mnemosyne]|uniref:FLYWCH-type domain-containing protein n=1 Tax=Parnassius mnemosyne TaxID=213953 RepID=A0AAV1K9X3_9NEOP